MIWKGGTFLSVMILLVFLVATCDAQNVSSSIQNNGKCENIPITTIDQDNSQHEPTFVEKFRGKRRSKYQSQHVIFRKKLFGTFLMVKHT